MDGFWKRPDWWGSPSTFSRLPPTWCKKNKQHRGAATDSERYADAFQAPFITGISQEQTTKPSTKVVEMTPPHQYDEVITSSGKGSPLVKLLLTLPSHSSQFSTSSYLAKMLSTGSCYCRAITYEVSLNSADDARTSICHCKNCKACTLLTFPFSHAPASVHSAHHNSLQRYRNSPAATLPSRPRSQGQPSRSSLAQNTSKYMKQTTGRAWSCTANSATPAAQDCWNMVYVIHLPYLSLACFYVRVESLSQYGKNDC